MSDIPSKVPGEKLGLQVRDLAPLDRLFKNVMRDLGRQVGVKSRQEQRPRLIGHSYSSGRFGRK